MVVPTIVIRHFFLMPVEECKLRVEVRRAAALAR
jgi:hypothetical protein